MTLMCPNTQIHHVNELALTVCAAFDHQAHGVLIQSSKPSSKVHPHPHTHTVTCEISRKVRLSLERVDFWMDDDAIVVTEPVGFTHPLLQCLTHILLRHMEDTQVRETAKEK